MSWDIEMPLIVRHLINDLGATPTYADSRLQELILITNKMLKFEISFSITYTSDLTNITLTPDPTISNPIDDDFISLCCLKAAIILLGGETNRATGQAIQVKDGSSLVDARNLVSSKLELLKFLQSQFDKAKLEYQTGGSVGVGQMIVSPFRLASTSSFGYGHQYNNYHY